ncbi:MAG: tyrosine-type recombinase/integrase [Acidiferrobacterales bacterium]
MSLNRRATVWWVDFYAPSGQRVRQSTRTDNRQAAQEFHDRLKAEYWRRDKLKERPRRSWEQAVVRWLKETSHKASHGDDKYHLRWLDRHLRGVYLDDITRERIDRIKEARKGGGVSNATVNRTLEALRAVLRRALSEWEWLDTVPTIRMLPEPKRRIRWITREQAERLLAELPAHLAATARFSLATGLRKSNVVGLQWSQVDLNRRLAWVHPDQAKARKAIAVPLNKEAMTVLRAQQGKHETYVFSYEGRAPVSHVNTRAWKNALARAGIKDFRWHDLRHTWASWHVQAGTPLHVLQELGAWESADMVKRYAHLSASHLAEYAERVAGPHVVTNRTQWRPAAKATRT